MRGTHADYSRRLGPVFAEQAVAFRGNIPRMEDHKEAYRKATLSERLDADPFSPVPAKAYKPTHGGYPG